MTTKIIYFFAFTILSLFACQNNKNFSQGGSATKPALVDVQYETVKNYYVKNTVLGSVKAKIGMQVEFNEIFGSATKMGVDGKPTVIDFAKQNVIAVVLQETDLKTTISPKSLQKDETGNLILTYSVIRGEKQSYTTRPNFAIVIDKSEMGKVTFKEL